MENIEKKEITLPDDLQKRFNDAKDDTERSAVMAEFSQRLGAVNTTKQEVAIMSDEQFRSFLDRVGQVSADQAKSAIAEVTEVTQRKYNLDGDEAKEIAEQSFDKIARQHQHMRADMEVAGKVLRGIYLARVGKPDAYQRAIDEEIAHYKKRGREIRSMTLSTDSTGGYLAPTLFSDMLYDNLARTSLVMQQATIIPMNGNEVINIPVKTSTVSAHQITEMTSAGSSTTSQPVFSQKQLGTKKLAAFVRPMSIEMIEKANPAIIPIILQDAIDQIKIKQDELVFGTSGNGIRANTTNDIVRGSAATGYPSLDYDDFIDLETELEPQYLNDKYITGSGMLGGVTRYYLPHALRQELKKKKETGTGAYLDEARELRNQGKIFGYEACTTLSLPNGSGLAANDKVAILGNLARVFVGIEPDFRILMNDTGSVDNGGSNVDLYQTSSVSMRVLQFFDSVVIDEESFSKIKLAA
jgi:HK97 family phage major capsid protein